MDGFVDLYRRLLRINFSGQAGDPLPAPADLSGAVSEGSLLLPHPYVEEYAVPLANGLAHIMQLMAANQLPAIALETLTGAVYQHSVSGGVNPHIFGGMNKTGPIGPF